MITSTHPVCVVIPVYQSNLLPSEHAALEQCIAVLGTHPIAIVRPEGLDITALAKNHPQLQFESFTDDFFDGVKGYNRLMLSDEFYSRFASYEFMLIYQLDAFVFSDQLLQWCSRGYDYIGAPWLPPVAVKGALLEMAVGLQRKLFRLLNRRSNCTDFTQEPQFKYSTGNGGFSLRRISSMRKVLTELHERAEGYRLATIEWWHEDLFFSVEANRYRTRLRIPSAHVSAHFSWETNPGVAATLTDGALPFGCHAWNKLHRSDWRPVFERLGHSLDSLLDRES